MVSNWVVLRRELLLGHPSGYGRRSALPKQPFAHMLISQADDAHAPLPAPGQLAWVLLRSEDTLTRSDQKLLERIRRDTDLDTALDWRQRSWPGLIASGLRKATPQKT